jgi:hypothetical protein
MTSNLNPHLTHEQLCDLILACSPHPLSSDFAALEKHLRTCPSCSEELNRLSRSLTNFREASTAYANRQLAEFHVRQNNHQTVLPTPHSLARPLYWACAAALVVAVLAPLGLRRHEAPAPTPEAAATVATVETQAQESDEALLEEINQDTSTSVPSPMRPLVDPAASSTNTSNSSNPPQTTQN